MKPRTFHFVFLLLLSCPCAIAQSLPLDQIEILGRLAQGFPPSYVAHLVKVRGVNFSVSQDFLSSVKLAGGDGVLVERLLAADDSERPRSLSYAEPSFDHLAKCAELIHTGALNSAEQECRASIDDNPKSPWPLIAAAQPLQLAPSGAISPRALEARKKQYTELLHRALAIAPNLASVHHDLAVDLPSRDAMAELQKASSLDPDGLEGNQLGASRFFLNAVDSFSVQFHAGIPPSSDKSITIEPDLLSQIQIDPDLALTHLGLAIQYFQVHNFETAERELREAIRLEPDSPLTHKSLGFFYLSLQEKEAALAEFRETVRIVPFGIYERMVLAGALEQFGRTPEAIAELQNLLAIYPSAVRPSNALVELYLDHKDAKSAIAELRRSLDASSLTFTDQAEFVDARLQDLDNLAKLLKEHGQLDAAAEQYLFLLRFKPDSADLHNDYGNVLLAQRRLDEAIGEYNEALRLDPQMATPHHNIGICLALKNNMDGAISEFRRALDLNPDEPNSQIFLGAALGQKGDFNAAITQFRKALEKNPKDPGAHASIGYALYQIKNYPEAIKELKLAIELKPDFPSAENNLAWLYVTADDPKLRNPAEALALARRAVQSAPSPANLDTLAEALLLNGKPAEALSTEERVAKLDPQNPDIPSRLAHFREAARHPSSPEPVSPQLSSSKP